VLLILLRKTVDFEPISDPNMLVCFFAMQLERKIALYKGSFFGVH
jgi:hypothetical protein